MPATEKLRHFRDRRTGKCLNATAISRDELARCSPWMAAIRPAIVLLTPMLVSCMQSNAPAGADLNRELTVRAAGPPQTCIPTVSNGSLHAIDSSTLVYRSGTTIYINHPAAPCPAIGPFSPLIVEAQSGHYCRGDRARGFELGATIAGPVCILGNWIAYRKP